MGAAQSKKKRKERKRRKRLLMGTSAFDLPRSASVDFIRTHSLLLSSCPHCQGLGTNSIDRHTISGLFHGSHKCTCRNRHAGEGTDEADGYQSCPSYSNSNCCLSVSNPGHPLGASTSACWDMERSTMSLNRNLNVRSNKIVQSKSSEFTELLDILKRYEDRKRELSSIIAPHSSSPLQMEDNKTNLSIPSSPTVALNNELPGPRGSTATREISKPVTKKPITLLEDDESRLARWKKQKMMAQQLRSLRKHIQLQEASQQKLPVPFLREPTAEEGEPKSSSHPEMGDREQILTQMVENVHRSQRSKFSKMSNYKYLDNHPVLSRLQNEQNNRLESMERRMKEIRISAMQEAERRKFAEIFPAKQDHSQTERMMQEAKEMLEKLKEEKKKKKEGTKGAEPQTDNSNALANANESRTVDDDSGEVIPVHVMSTSAVRSVNNNTINLVEQQIVLRTDGKEEKKDGEDKKKDWLNNAWPNMNLDQPLTWLLLPFLLFPLILRLLLNLIISTGTNTGHNTDGRNTGHREAKPKR